MGGITKNTLDFMRRRGNKQPFALDEATGLYSPAQEEAPPDWGMSVTPTPPARDVVDMSTEGLDVTPSPRDIVDMSTEGTDINPTPKDLVDMSDSPMSISPTIQRAVNRYPDRQLETLDNQFLQKYGAEPKASQLVDEEKAFKKYGESLGIHGDEPISTPKGFEGSGLAAMMGRTKDMTQAMAEPKFAPVPESVPAVEPAPKNKEPMYASMGAPSNVIDVGKDETNSLQELKGIQENANLARLTNQLGAAGELIGTSIARTKPIAQQLFKDNIAQADQGVKDFKDRQTLEKDQPDSPMSKAYRGFLKKLGVTVKGDFTAAMGEKMSPLYWNMFKEAEDNKAKKEIAEQNRIAAKTMKEDQRKAMDQVRDDTFITHSYDKLVKSKPYEQLTNIDGRLKSIDNAIKNPSSVNDIVGLYDFIKELDPDSAVREGEVKLGREGLGLWGRISVAISDAGPKPRILNQQILRDVKKYMEMRKKNVLTQYDDLRQSAFAQAKDRNVDPSRWGGMDPIYLKEQNSKSPAGGPPKVDQDKLAAELKKRGIQ